MTFDELKEKAHALPLKPGVYIMQDVHSTVIYVGKAKALKNRVSQYFQDSASHTEKTRAMVSQIDHFDVIIADSEFEALVLENSLMSAREAAEALAPLTRSEVVQVIGTKFVLYRPSHRKDKKDKIVLVEDKKKRGV